MVLFAFFMMWAYPYKEYVKKDDTEKGIKQTTSIWRPLWDSINFSDFLYEIWTSLKFFFDFVRRKPHTRSEAKSHPGGVDFKTAFGVEESDSESTERFKDPNAYPAGQQQYGYGTRETYPMDQIAAQPLRKDAPGHQAGAWNQSRV